MEEDSIFLEVEVWEMSDGTDTQGFLKLTKRHIVEFEFHDIVSTDLEQFTPENILFELEFSSNQQRQEQGFFKVV